MAATFVIQHSSTGEFAGWTGFPRKGVAEWPDARKFETRKQAEAALKGAFHEAGGIDAASKMLGWEVVEG